MPDNADEVHAGTPLQVEIIIVGTLEVVCDSLYKNAIALIAVYCE